MVYRPAAPEQRCYRIIVFDVPRTRWRPSVEAAIADAIALRLASWDASRREHYLAVPVALQVREG